MMEGTDLGIYFRYKPNPQGAQCGPILQTYPFSLVFETLITGFSYSEFEINLKEHIAISFYQATSPTWGPVWAHSASVVHFGPSLPKPNPCGPQLVMLSGKSN